MYALLSSPLSLSLSLSLSLLFLGGQNEVEARASVPLRSYAPELLHYVHVPPFFVTPLTPLVCLNIGEFYHLL